MDEGETVEQAGCREALEETGLEVALTALLHVYSDPGRDPRMHTMSTVFVARAEAEPVAGDDATDARVFALDALPAQLAFDHAQILEDYVRFVETGVRPL